MFFHSLKEMYVDLLWSLCYFSGKTVLFFKFKPGLRVRENS